MLLLRRRQLRTVLSWRPRSGCMVQTVLHCYVILRYGVWTGLFECWVSLSVCSLVGAGDHGLFDVCTVMFAFIVPVCLR